MTFVRSCADLKEVGDIIPNLTPPLPEYSPLLEKNSRSVHGCVMIMNIMDSIRIQDHDLHVALFFFTFSVRHNVSNK